MATGNLLRDIEIVLSPTRTVAGLRADLEKMRPVLLLFKRCQHLEFTNDLPEEQRGEEPRWGLNEIALIEACGADGDLVFNVKWESRREIVLRCQEFQVVEAPGWDKEHGFDPMALDADRNLPLDRTEPGGNP